MACTNDKFVINKSMSNEFILTIKQNDSTLPMVIDPSDTFSLKLYKLDTNAVVSTIDMSAGTDGQITVYDDANGQIQIVMNTSMVSGLVVDRGTKADRYYLRPGYRLAIDCNTVNNGNFVAKINEVYVEE